MKRNFAAATALAVLLAGFSGALPANATTSENIQDLLDAGIEEQVVADLSAPEKALIADSLGEAENSATVTVVTLEGSEPQFETVAVEDSAADEVAAILGDQPSVEVAGVAQPVSIAAGDPYRFYQWPLNTLRAEESRALLPSGSRPVVAVVDTGVLGTHPDLTNVVLPGKDFITTNGSSDGRIDPHSHGTHVAGIIGASVGNGIGVEGFLSNVSILPIRVMDANGAGNTALTAQGVTWAANNGADVINLSLGGTGHDPSLQYAVEYAVSQGVAVVAAMGNDGNTVPFYPANYSAAIAVGATDSNNAKASYSNMGTHIDVAAPGSMIISTGNQGGETPYLYKSGTSMAAPHVAAVVAGLGAKYPTLSPAQLQDHLQKTASDLGTTGFDTSYGHGLVSPYKAYSNVPGQQLTNLPSAPKSIAATAGVSQANVSWSAPDATGSSSLTGYTVTLTSPGLSAVTANVGASTLLTTVNGLTNGAVYSATVVARNAQGAGPATSSVNVTPRTVPNAPSQPTTTRGNGEVSLAWNAPSFNGGSAITGYTASILAPTGAPVTKNLSADTTTFTFTGLTNGTSYSMTVKASNVAGSSPASFTSYAMPLGVPSAPPILWTLPDDQSAGIAWDSPSSNGGANVTGYVVTATSTAGNKTMDVSAGTYSAKLTGLTNEVAYSMSVRAQNSQGLSPASASETVTPTMRKPTLIAPNAPVVTSATPAPSSLQVAWNAPSQPGTNPVSGYTVTATRSGVVAGSITTSARTATLVGLTNGLSYSVAVQAHSAAGSSGLSAAVSGVPHAIPGAPAVTKVEPRNGGVGVYWSAPASNGSTITSYQIAISRPGYANLNYTAAGNAGALGVTGLTNGITYGVHVRAFNAAGGSSYSTTVNVIPRTIPSVPVVTKLAPSNGAVGVYWKPSANGGSAITSYQVAISRPGQPNKYYTAAGNATAISAKGLVNGVTYGVHVRAFNAAGVSSFSKVLYTVPRTVPTAPRSPVVSAGSTRDKAIAVGTRWTAPSSNGGSALTGYTVRLRKAGTTKDIVKSVNGRTQSVVFTGLAKNAKYTVTVQAHNAAGVSPLSTRSAANIAR